jgi:hypothetical protein
MKTVNIYQKQLEVLAGRSSKKVANNTWLQVRPNEGENGVIALKYHDTDVVTYNSNGLVVMDTGGWRTSTTKLRFNESYAKLPVSVWANKGVWFVSMANDFVEPRQRRFSCYSCPHHWTADATLSEITNNLSGEKSEFCPKCGKKYGYASSYLCHEYAFEDGFSFVEKDGNYLVDMSTVGEDPKKSRKLRKKVQTYAAGFISALFAGKVGPPSAGDCFYCQMRTVDGNVPLGEQVKDRSHIEGHIAEKYYVPSLLVRATEVMPCSQAMKWAIGEQWQAPKSDGQKVMDKIDSGWSQHDFIRVELVKMVQRYVLRQLGEVS